MFTKIRPNVHLNLTNIHSGLHHLSWQQRAMNVAFFVFPMAIAPLIYTYGQGYFPPESHKLRQAIGQPKKKKHPMGCTPMPNNLISKRYIKTGLEHTTWEAR